MKEFIKILLLVQGIGMTISSLIYGFTIKGDQWFTRLAMSLICLGLYGIILAIEENTKKIK